MNVIFTLFSFGMFFVFVSGTLVGIKANTLSKIVNNIPLEVVEMGVSFSYENDSYGGYFNKNNLESEVKYYLNLNLEDYVKTYKISFIYFYLDSNNETRIDLSDYPTNVQIHTEVNYHLNYKVHGYVYFTVGDFISA